MIIRKLQLNYFGKFNEAEFEFRRGLNLVVGPNEAGKSTLMEAVPAILFGVRDKGRFRSWGRRGDSCGSLTLEQRGGALKIDRNITTNKVELTELDQLYQEQSSFTGKVSPQGRSSEARVYAEILEESFGVADELLLRTSLFFGQGQLELPTQKSFPGRIKALLSGSGSQDYDQVLESLRDDYFKLTRTNPWGKNKSHARELEQVEERRDQILQQIALLQPELEDADGVSRQTETLSRSIRELQDEIAAGERYLSWLQQYYQLSDQRAALVARLEEVESTIKQVSELTAALSTIDQQLPETESATVTGQSQGLSLRLQMFREQLDRLQQETDELQQKLNQLVQPPLWPALLATLLGAAAVVGGTGYFPEWSTQVAIGGGLMAGLTWLVCGRQRLIYRIHTAGLRDRLSQLQALEPRIRAQIENLVGQQLPASSPAETAAGEGTIRSLLLKRGELAGELKALPKLADQQQQYQQLIRELAVLDERLGSLRQPVKSRDLAPHELEGAEQKLEQKRRQLAELNQQAAGLVGRSDGHKAASQEYQQLQESLIELQQRQKLLQQRIAALQLGHDVLADAVSQYREGYLGRLADTVARKLKQLTAGRHESIRFDEALKPFLRGRKGSWQPLDLFSSGTRDLVYLVIRLAFQELIHPGSKLPILLDDPFVNLDQSRRQRMLASLEQLSAERQIILFSHDPKLLGKASRDRWHVLLLDDQSRSQSTPEEEANVGQLHLL